MHSLIKKRGFNTIFAIVFNVGFAAFSLVFFKAQFSVDDFALCQFLANGHYEFISSNYYLERLFGLIQNAVFPLNAYFILSSIITLSGFIVVTKGFIEKNGLKIGALIALLMNAVFAICYTLQFSFTMFAAIDSAMGLWIVIHYSRQKKWIAGVIFGGLLSVVGGLYRFKIFESVFVMGVAVVLALSLSDYMDLEQAKRKVVDFLKIAFEPKRLTAAGLIVILSFSMNTISTRKFKSDETMRYYMSYTAARSKVFDFEIPAYEKAKAEYDDIGVDSTELTLIEKCVLDDEGGLSLENLNKIKDIADRYNNSHFNALSTVKSVAATQLFEMIRFTTEGIADLALLLVLGIYFFLQKKKKIVPPLIIVAFLVPFYLYLGFIGRAPYRVKCGLLLMAILGTLYLIDVERLKQFNKKYVKTIVAIVVLCFSLGAFALNIKNMEQSSHPARDSAAAAIYEMAQDTESKYEFFGIETMSMLTEADVRDVFHIAKVNQNTNLFNQPSTYYLTPFYFELLERFGTDNVYRNLLNKNVYAVFRNTDDRKDLEKCMQQYLEKYYADGKTVTMKKVRSFEDFSVYKYALVEGEK